MRSACGLVAASVLVFCGIVAAAAPAADAADFRINGQRFTKSVVSLQEIRQNQVVRQNWDFTCGAAALATILRYQHGLEVEEREIVETLVPVSGRSLNAILRDGFSLLDLKRYAVARGLDAKGYAELTLEDLQEFNMPAIVPVFLFGFNHFVIFRDVKGDRVFVADPAVGNAVIRRDKFLDAWQDGIGFFILDGSGGAESADRHELELERVELLFPDKRRNIALMSRRLELRTRRSLSGRITSVLEGFGTDFTTSIVNQSVSLSGSGLDAAGQ